MKKHLISQRKVHYFLAPIILLLLIGIGIMFNHLLFSTTAGSTTVFFESSEAESHAQRPAYHIRVNEDGRYESQSPAQDLEFTYVNNAYQVVTGPTAPESGQKVLYTLAGVSVNGSLLPMELSPDNVVRHNRLSQQHGAAFRVDHTNMEAGMRQDFVFFEGPADEAIFRVKLQLETNLQPALVGGNALLLSDPGTGQKRLSYKDLKAFDANGKKLAVRMDLSPSGINEHTYNVLLEASGSGLTYPVTVDPLNAAEWSVQGGTSQDRLGTSVAVCDVNGDNRDDLIVGVPGARRDSGQVQVFLASMAGVLPNVPSFTINAYQPSSRFGATLACAGDVDGDGFNDILVGASDYDVFWNPVESDTLPGWDTSDLNPDNIDRDEGAIFIYYGSSSGLDTVTSSTNDPVDTLFGHVDTMRLGYSLSALGDINGDGVDDIIAGAFSYSGTLNGQGAASIYYGADSGIAASTGRTAGIPTGGGTPDELVTSPQGEAGGLFGSSVAGVGDLNGDGRNDFVVSALGESGSTLPKAGKAHVFFGGSPASSVHRSLSGQAASSRFGSALAAGDFNGDGEIDIAVGADQDGFGGAVFIFDGNGTDVNPNFSKRIDGPGLSRSGASLTVGNFNGPTDTIDDLIVGAPGFSAGQGNEGAAIGYYGSAGGLVEPAGWLMESDIDTAYFGNALAAGDFNGDGADDVAVGAFSLSDGSASLFGGVYTFYATPDCGLPQYGSEPVFLSFPANISASAGADSCGTVVFFDLPTGAGDCGVTISQPANGPGSVFGVGVHSLIYRVTDTAGNFVDSTLTIEVTDDQAPVVAACPGTTLINIPTGETEGAITYDVPTFSDNCALPADQPVLVAGPAPGETLEIGVHPVQYSATDLGGNTTNCIFKVIIIGGNSPEQSCQPFELSGRDNIAVAVDSDAARVEYKRGFTDSFLDQQPKLGLDFLLKIVNSVLSDELGLPKIPDWVIQLMGGGDGGINLAFVTFSFGVTPGFDFDYGVYSDIIGSGNATIDATVTTNVCVNHPAADYFGCGDTISISTSQEILTEGVDLEVDPGTLTQAFGIFLSDFVVGLNGFVKATACLGIPNPIPIGPRCLGVPKDIGTINIEIIPEYNIFKSVYEADPNNGIIAQQGSSYEIKVPILVVCDDFYDTLIPDLSDAVTCAAGISPDSLSIFKFVNDLLGAAATGAASNPFSYDEDKDEIVVSVPDAWGLIPGFPSLPEFDFTFGRLNADDITGLPTITGDKISQTACEFNFQKARLDVFSLLDLALSPVLDRVNDVSGPIISIGSTITLFSGVFTLDLADINVSLRNKLIGNYSIEPQVTLNEIQLGQPMYYKKNGIWSAAPATSIPNVASGEVLELVIPDYPPTPSPAYDDSMKPSSITNSNTYTITGLVTLETQRQANLDLGFKAFEIGGSIFAAAGTTLPALVCVDPLASVNYDLARVQYQQKTIELRAFDENMNVIQPMATWTLEPDDIPAVVTTKDAIVYLSDRGSAVVTPESVFNSNPSLSYDPPIGPPPGFPVTVDPATGAPRGTGKINLLEVIPSTITCAMRPADQFGSETFEVVAELITEDDNCNITRTEFTVTVRDTVSPFITCRDLTVALNEEGKYTLNPDEVAIGVQDNCSFVEVSITPSALGCAQLGPNAVQVEAVDGAGNRSVCMATVTVIDTLPPTLVCPIPPGIPAERLAAPNQCSYTAVAGEFAAAFERDDCSVVTTYEFTGATTRGPITGTDLSGQAFNLGATSVTYTATDASGNVSVCSFTVNVSDDQAPAFAVAPQDQVFECSLTENETALQNWLNSFAGAIGTDNCLLAGPLGLSYELEDIENGCGNTQAYTYSFTIEDASGNRTTERAIFQIVDTTPPNIDREAENIRIICSNGAPDLEDLVAWLENNGNASAADACGDFTWSNNFVFDEADLLCSKGSIGVTFTATDLCGNSSETIATITIESLDFGDLPDDDDNGRYPTELEENGARHAVPPTGARITLGQTLDTEEDGIPDPLANGDGDDEDGIQFLTPFVEGQLATIRVSAVNQSVNPARLYPFADFNGDGVLTPLPLASPVIIPPMINTPTSLDFSFVVPNIDGANGTLYFRFRLSSDPAADQPSGLARDGEVEDYVVKLAKIGNVVWFDQNRDGIQNTEEVGLGINGLPLTLTYLGLDGVRGGGDDMVFDQDNTATALTGSDPRTGLDGVYEFKGLIGGAYELSFTEPDGLNLTTTHVPTEADRDSDGLPGAEENSIVIPIRISDPMALPVGEDGIADQILGNNIVEVNNWGGYPDGQVDQSIDIGLSGADWGDLPDLGYPTTASENGPWHSTPVPDLIPNAPLLYFGDGVDMDPDGRRDADGKAFGDDTDTDVPDDGDDEDGVRLVSPLVPGYEACVEVRTTIPEGETAHLNIWFDFDGNGQLDDGDHAVSNYILVAGPDVVTTVCFNVPAGAVFSDGGLAFARFRLTTDPAAGLTPTGGAPDGEVEDYRFELGKVGNLVWNDDNFNGLQDDGERGLLGVPVTLLFLGNEEVGLREYQTITSTIGGQNGLYYFCGLIPGDYQIRINTPMDMTPTRWDIGDDEARDSDGLIADLDLSVVITEIFRLPDNMLTLPEGEGGLASLGTYNDYPDNQIDETWDFGFAAIDHGDLPEEESGKRFNTRVAENGPSHVISEDLYLGRCIDAERDGRPDDDAGLFDGEPFDQGAGDDGTRSAFFQPMLSESEVCPDGGVIGRISAASLSCSSGIILIAEENVGTAGYWVVDLPVLNNAILNAGGLQRVIGQYVVANDLAVVGVPPLGDGSIPVDVVTRNGCVAGAEGLASARQTGSIVEIGCVDLLDNLSCEDDEDGIAFLTPLFPGQEACIAVDAVNHTGAVAVLQGWLDWNGNGEMEDGEELVFTDATLPEGEVTDAVYCFAVPDEVQYDAGNMYARFRLSSAGGLQVDGPALYGTEEMPLGEVEDYFINTSSVGNLVWEDRNYNGLQDQDEMPLGINGIDVTLIFGGTRPDGSLDEIGDLGQVEDLESVQTTGTWTFSDGSAVNGIYYFTGLLPGHYRVEIRDPNLAAGTDLFDGIKDLTPTIPNNIRNTTEEDRDSDGLPKEDNPYEVYADFTIANASQVRNLGIDEEGIGDQDLNRLPAPNRVFGAPDQQVDQRIDFGFVALDFGDLPDQSIASEHPAHPYKYSTTLDSDGARHLLSPDYYLGSSVDADRNGTPDAEAGYKGNGVDSGDDQLDTDADSFRHGAPGSDDEDGIRFITPLIPGYEACIQVSYKVPNNFNGPDGYFKAWADWDGSGGLEEGEQILFHSMNGTKAPVEPNSGAVELERIYLDQGENHTITLCFDVPEDATFLEGAAFFRFRLTATNPLIGPAGILAPETGYPDGRTPYGEVEDYFVPLAKIGNLVWEDQNWDWLQEFGNYRRDREPGINGVQVYLIYSGKDGVFDTEFDAQKAPVASGDDRVYQTVTANVEGEDGLYYFCGLIENGAAAGDEHAYRLVMITPEEMHPVLPNQPPVNMEDLIDSDLANGSMTDQTIDDLTMVMLDFEILYGEADDQLTGEDGLADDHGEAPEYVSKNPDHELWQKFPDEHVNQSFDVGFYFPCMNVADAGEIGYDQALCGPGNTPETLVSLRDPSGGEGELQYLWMKSTEHSEFDMNTWEIVPDSNSPTLEPGPIYETTYFARCVRRENCVSYRETNVLKITVGDEAVAQVVGPSTICKGADVTFVSGAHGPGALISWELERISVRATGTGPDFSYLFEYTGIYYLHLTVTENNCTSRVTHRVSVSTNPFVCDNSFSIIAEAEQESREVNVTWKIPDDGELRTYTVEYTKDGSRFTPVGTVEQAAIRQDGWNHFEFRHQQPRIGWNYYRVRQEDWSGKAVYSNVADAAIHRGQLAFAYPNPLGDEQLTIELLETFNQRVRFEIYDVRGALIGAHEDAGDLRRYELDFTDIPAGVYVVHVRYGDKPLEVIRIVKQ